jgi:tetratricopeptide (TPR) repeat protein
MSVSDVLGNTVLMFALGLSVLLPVAVAAAKLLQFIYASLKRRQKVKHAQELAALARPVKAGQPAFVRHDDVVQLTTAQLKMKARAAEMVQEGDPKGAAHIYRQLTLDRLAIQTLEDAGLIKEACQVLFDKQLPNRAGILCERNGYFMEAAECYKIAKMFVEAGNAYIKASSRDYRLLRKAAEMFEEGRAIRDATWAYEAILDFDKACALCLQHKDYSRILALALNPEFPLSILEGMDRGQCDAVLDGLVLTPKSVQDLGAVAGRLHGIFTFSSMTKKVANDGALMRHFVKSAGKVAIDHWLQTLEIGKENWESKAWPLMAEILAKVGLVAQGGRVFELSGQLANVARCYLSAGKFETVKSMISKSGTPEQVKEVDMVLVRYQNALASGDVSGASSRFWDESNRLLTMVFGDVG